MGLTLGGSAVLWVLYQDVERTVDQTLSGALWDLPGQVTSGPVELWPGLTAAPDDLADDLKRAGFARVKAPARAGDFSVSGDALRVLTDSGDHLITFRGERIASISPRERLTLPPTQLASIRGPSNEDRAPKPLDHFPEHLQQAVLAMEDADFWKHRGVSPLGVLRALVRNVIAGQTLQGGSTLTQQLAKNLFLSPERTLTRKAREALFAFALEQELDKREILALYLNQIYWGQHNGAAICGAEQAARAFFGKPADRLTIGEAATLGGIISAPNTYNPLRHPDRAKARRDLTLQRMVTVGWLDPEIAEAERAKPLEIAPARPGRRAPYAVDMALEAAESLLGEGAVARLGLTVRTEINPLIQRLAESTLAEALPELEAEHTSAAGVQAAAVVVRASDGAVLAMVGGRDYGASQFNRATQARRQPGSTVKPLTMLAAFERDPSLAPSSVLEDEPLTLSFDGKSWSPANYDGRYVGEISVRESIARSRNIPAVLLAEQVGLRGLHRWFLQLGLSGATGLPSASLGAFDATPLEIAGAYTVFPGGGTWAAPRVLRAVEGGDGEVLLRNNPDLRPLASPRAAQLSTDVLTSVLSDGTGRQAADYGATGALGGKTGTTDDYRDAWFVGFTPELVIAVWVGFDDNESHGLTGSQAALPIWARLVAALDTQTGALPSTEEVVTAEICVGGWEDGACSECAVEVFSAGEAPEGGCDAPPAEVGEALSEAVQQLVRSRMEDREPAPRAERDRRRLFGRRD